MTTTNVLTFVQKPSDHFGLCPVCKQEPQVRNVHKANFAVCLKHKMYWSIGWNLLSGWQQETEADWQRNGLLLESFAEVEPFSYPRFHANLKHQDLMP